MAKARTDSDATGDNHDQGERRPRKMSALQRAVEQAMGDGVELGDPDDEASATWPNVWEWLTQVYVNRDEMKSPATLSVRAVVGGFVVGLNDRDLAVSVNVPIKRLAAALDSLEAVLADPSHPLINYGKKEPVLRKRRKR